MFQINACGNLVNMLAAGTSRPDKPLFKILLADAERVHLLQQRYLFLATHTEIRHLARVSSLDQLFHIGHRPKPPQLCYISGLVATCISRFNATARLRRELLHRVEVAQSVGRFPNRPYGVAVPARQVGSAVQKSLEGGVGENLSV